MTVPDDFTGGFTNPTPPPPGVGPGPGQAAPPGWSNPPPAGYGPPPGYGAPPPYGTGGMQNGMGIAALIIGIIAMLLGVLVIGGLLGALAVGLGFAGRSRAKQGLADNKGVATVGIITGLIGILLAVAVVAALFVGGWEFWHSKTVKDIRECVSSHQTAAQQAACEEKFGITPSPAAAG
jgi:hypothetical protein